MKVVVVGASGTIGAAVVEALRERHEVVGVTRHSEPPVDIEQLSSIEALFANVSGVDAVVSCSGRAAWKPLFELSSEDFALSLANKLMGQVNLIRVALRHVREGGSITVTSGILAQSPMPGSAAVSLVNAGLEGFVRAAALEAERGIRVNVVSPPWVTDTLVALGMDPKMGLPPKTVARAYVAAVEGSVSGQTIRASDFG